MKYYLTQLGEEFKASVAGVPFSRMKTILRSPTQAGQWTGTNIARMQKAQVIAKRKAGVGGDINPAQEISPEIAAAKKRARDVGQRVAGRQERYGASRGETGRASDLRHFTSYQRFGKNYRIGKRNVLGHLADRR